MPSRRFVSFKLLTMAVSCTAMTTWTLAVISHYPGLSGIWTGSIFPISDFADRFKPLAEQFRVK